MRMYAYIHTYDNMYRYRTYLNTFLLMRAALLSHSYIQTFVCMCIHLLLYVLVSRGKLAEREREREIEIEMSRGS